MARTRKTTPPPDSTYTYDAGASRRSRNELQAKRDSIADSAAYIRAYGTGYRNLYMENAPDSLRTHAGKAGHKAAERTRVATGNKKKAAKKTGTTTYTIDGHTFSISTK